MKPWRNSNMIHHHKVNQAHQHHEWMTLRQVTPVMLLSKIRGIKALRISQRRRMNPPMSREQRKKSTWTQLGATLQITMKRLRAPAIETIEEMATLHQNTFCQAHGRAIKLPKQYRNSPILRHWWHDRELGRPHRLRRIWRPIHPPPAETTIHCPQAKAWDKRRERIHRKWWDERQDTYERTDQVYSIRQRVDWINSGYCLTTNQMYICSAI